MELKRYIESIAKVITPSIDHLQLVEYKDKELDYHTSFKRMFKQIIRIIFR